jgi:hypothetical protein
MIMKKLGLIISAVFLTLGVACADVDRPISVEELPQKAQKFLKAHFSERDVSFAKEDPEFMYKDYEVVLTDGTKIEFASDGEWTSVDCRYGSVPMAIVPKQIEDYLKKNYPNVTVLGIDHERKEYEVRLNNRLELTFDKHFRLIDIDD